ncbi:MAG: hypothetical protein U0Y68_20655 [Blastocatellia bacterium]
MAFKSCLEVRPTPSPVAIRRQHYANHELQRRQRQRVVFNSPGDCLAALCHTSVCAEGRIVRGAEWQPDRRTVLQICRLYGLQNQINILRSRPATTDIENPSQQGARWSAYFFSLEGSRIRAYECFEEFSLSAGIATQEWTTICRYQSGLARALPDNATLTREQIYGLIGQNSISATPNYFVKGNPAGTGVTSAAAYESSGNVTFTGQTDLLGGIPQKTAAEIASLAGGAPGRVFYQTDGLKGFYRDYGAAVGVRHIGGYYDALELGFIPTDSSSGTRSANSARWSAVITALPATGEVIRFPSGSFYFATKLSSSKPVNIVGAGAAFVSGGTTTGTTLIVESGQTGIEFLAGAKSSSVENITLKTRSGISGQTTGDGVYSNATIKLKNVSIESFARHGVFLDSTVVGATTDFSILERVDVWGTGSDGFRYDNQTDSNVITTTNCNATLVGRHGFYDGGASNTFIGCHVAYAGQIDATGKDYYENGNGNTWIRPYSESTASNKFYFGTNSTSAFLQTGTFGAPVVEFANSSIALAAHTIIEGNKQRDFWLTSRTSTALSPGDHDYSVSSTNGNGAGEFLVFDQTAGQTAISYLPANRVLSAYRMQPTNLAPVVVSPAQITADQNNYTPTNGSTYWLTSDAVADGLGSGSGGRRGDHD